MQQSTGKASEEELQRTYSINKKYEKIDIIGLILSYSFTIVSSLGVDIHNFDNLFYMILFLIISGFITILTVITFFIMFRKMDQFEDKLGIDISILDNH